MSTNVTTKELEKSILFSIVIPTYKRKLELLECLSHLKPYFSSSSIPRSKNSIEVIVSDDAADTELANTVEQRYPWCRYVVGPAKGPAANRNYGASKAEGKWIIFTDDDCLPQPGWLEAYAELADQYDVMEGRTSAKGIRRRIDEECPTNETGGYLWSCNFAIRRQVFNDLRGFNEGFPAAAMEDVELRKRIEKSGFRVAYIPHAVVYHPWRVRKGAKFLRDKAKSIAFCVQLHPEMKDNFALKTILRKTLTQGKLSLISCIQNKSIRGASRQIFLDIYLSILTWIEVKKMNHHKVPTKTFNYH